MNKERERVEQLTTLSWARCWAGAGGAGNGNALREQLLQAWSEPQRHYHTLQHLNECLGLYEQVRSLAQSPAAVELAIWFHDAIYDVKGKDNEARSAQWARSALSQAGVNTATVAHAERLIMATCHDAAPNEPDAQLLVDVDLAILGAEVERFREYETQVRAEYAWVPDFLYRRKRREILQGLLARPSLYSTLALREKLEGKARQNLALSIAALGG